MNVIKNYRINRLDFGEYKANKKNTQQKEQEVIIDDIIKELVKKRDIARHVKKQLN